MNIYIYVTVNEQIWRMLTFTSECRHSPSPLVYVQDTCKYPYFGRTPVNMDIQHALMMNVEDIRDLYFFSS